MIIRIEIGEHLFLEVTARYTPGDDGYISGPPENCREPEYATCEWEDEDVELICETRGLVDTGKTLVDYVKVYETGTVEKRFKAPKGFSDIYEEDIIKRSHEIYKETVCR